MTLSVILLSMLMILLSTLNVIKHLNLNLIYKTLDWGRKLLVNFNDGKTQLVLDGSIFEEKSSFKMQRLDFSSKLDLSSCIILQYL